MWDFDDKDQGLEPPWKGTTDFAVPLSVYEEWTAVTESVHFTCPRCGGHKSYGGRLCRRCESKWWRPLQRFLDGRLNQWQEWLSKEAQAMGLDPDQGPPCPGCGSDEVVMWWYQNDGRLRPVWYCKACKGVFEIEGECHGE